MTKGYLKWVFINNNYQLLTPTQNFRVTHNVNNVTDNKNKYKNVHKIKMSKKWFFTINSYGDSSILPTTYKI